MTPDPKVLVSTSSKGVTSVVSWNRCSPLQHHGKHHEPVLVDQVMVDQRVEQVGAAKQQDVTARLLFQLGDRLGGIPLMMLAFCQPTVPRLWRRGTGGARSSDRPSLHRWEPLERTRRVVHRAILLLGGLVLSDVDRPGHAQPSDRRAAEAARARPLPSTWAPPPHQVGLALLGEPAKPPIDGCPVPSSSAAGAGLHDHHPLGAGLRVHRGDRLDASAQSCVTNGSW